MEILIYISPRCLGQLDKIARAGKASHGHAQDAEFCIRKAVDEFIEKYMPFEEEED